MATITLPNQPYNTQRDAGFTRLRVRRIASSFRSMSPYSLDQQVKRNTGILLFVDFTLHPLDQTEAESWITALNDLVDLRNTFDLELGLWYSNYSTTSFRLANPEYFIDLNPPFYSSLTVNAMEAR